MVSTPSRCSACSDSVTLLTSLPGISAICAGGASSWGALAPVSALVLAQPARPRPTVISSAASRSCLRIGGYLLAWASREPLVEHREVQWGQDGDGDHAPKDDPHQWRRH